MALFTSLHLKLSFVYSVALFEKRRRAISSTWTSVLNLKQKAYCVVAAVEGFPTKMKNVENFARKSGNDSFRFATEKKIRNCKKGGTELGAAALENLFN